MTPAARQAARLAIFTDAMIDDAPGSNDAAHALANHLNATMPADIIICRYKVSSSHVNGQLNAGFHADSSERLIRIAETFGLHYAETPYDDGRLDLSARGVIDGIDVRFWDNVPVPTPTAPKCGCDCHRTGATS